MTKSKRINAYALALIGATVSIASLAGVGYARADRDNASSACEVAVERNGGSLAISAVYNAQESVTGSYRFAVSSVGGAGRTNINQGGGFSARAGESVTIGQVNVAGSSTYDVTLDIDAGGERYTCGGRYGA